MDSSRLLPGLNVRKDAHLAAALKKFITILLLIIMAIQATHFFYAKLVDSQLVQDLDEKKDKESKEDKKEDKELFSHSFSLHPKSINKATFNSMPVIIIPSPVMDHLTPPPDWASYI